MKYVVSERALEIIERECRNHPDTETGGIIVGLRDDVQVTITHATGPGVISLPEAIRSALPETTLSGVPSWWAMPEARRPTVLRRSA